METGNALILEKINRELEAFLARKSNNKDSTNGVFDFLLPISDSVQEELISNDSDKKRFLRALSRLFALLLSTKVDTAEKIKITFKFATEATLKIWQKPSQQ